MQGWAKPGIANSEKGEALNCKCREGQSPELQIQGRAKP